MKTAKMFTILVLGLVVCQAEVSEAAPMGTAWTYQGRLIDANDAADGLYDFQFKLFDDPCTGAQQGGTIEAGDLDVIDGYFTVELDFGSDVFNGDARWLEIGVRPGDSNDPNAFATLSLRQEITPTPYSLQTRGIFVDYNGNVGIGTTNPSTKFHLDGQSLWLTGGNGGGFPPSAGAGLRLFHDGSTAHIWAHDYQAQQPTDMTFQAPGGNVGIGTTSPGERLHVIGNIAVSGTVDGVDLSAHAANPNAHHTPPTTLPPSGPAGGDLSGTYPSPSVLNDSHTHGDGTVSDNISINNARLFAPAGAGNVGIGTTSPIAELDVAGTVKADAFIGDGSGLTGIIGSSIWTASGSDIYYNSGNVGIGTTSPTQRLDVADNITASRYYDRNNTGYYVDPASTSNLNTVYAGSAYASNAYAYKFYDRDDTGYYVDPAHISYCKYMRATIFQDMDNINYYMDPTDTSRFYNVRVRDFSGSINYAMGAGDLYVEHELEVDGAVYMTGVYSHSMTGRDVKITSGGRMGTLLSSKRFKENINRLEDDFTKILEAQPVTFVWKESKEPDIGLIAEDMDELGLKNLVFYDKEGRPDGVRYDFISLYLLEVVKDQANSIKELKAENESLKEQLQKENQSLKQRLNALERTVRQIAKAKEVKL